MSKTGEILRFLTSKRILKVYSIGQNGIDDGGVFDRRSSSNGPDDLGFTFTKN